MKTTPTTLQKAFRTARAISDIKPVLQCIEVKDKWLTCTDSFRLHSMKYLTGTAYQLPDGIYNPDTMEQLTDNAYPDHKHILHTEHEVYAGDIQTLKEMYLKAPITDIKLNSITFLDLPFNKKYVGEALTFLEQFVNLTKCHTVKVYTKKESTAYKPLVINVYDMPTDPELVAYALLMPLLK